MKSTLKKVLFGLVAAATILTTFTACPPPKPEKVEPVTFNGVVDGAVKKEGSKIKLSCETTDADVYFSLTTTLTAQNCTSEGTKGFSVTLPSVNEPTEVTISAIAVKGSKFSPESHVTVTVKPGVKAVTFSKEVPEGKDFLELTSRNETVTLASATEGAKIYIRTDGDDIDEDSIADLIEAGTVTEYADAIAISNNLYISAIAAKDGEYSAVSSIWFKVPRKYIDKAVAQDTLDGGIAEIIETVNGSAASVTIDNKNIKGYVLSTATNGLFIQDKDAGVQLYNKDKLGDVSMYQVGDYVEVSGVSAAQFYTGGGVVEITAFAGITRFERKATADFYYTKVSNLATDFSEYVPKLAAGGYSGDCGLFGIRAIGANCTDEPFWIYGAGSDTTEKAYFGRIVNYNGKLEFSPYFKDDNADVIEIDVAKVANPVAVKPAGTYDAGTVLSFTCETEGATVYYATEAFGKADFDASNTDKFKTGDLTLEKTTTVWVIAVKDTDLSNIVRITYNKTKNITYVALSDTNNYDLSAVRSEEDTVRFADINASIATPSNAKVFGVIVAIDASNNWLVQDEGAGLYMYKVAIPQGASIGSLVSFSVTAGSNFNGLPEVTAVADMTVVNADYTETIFYANLTGLTDFTTSPAFGTLQLCAVRGLAADYKASPIQIQKPLSQEDVGHLGYAYTYTKSTSHQLVDMMNVAADLIDMPAGTIKDPEFDVKAGSVLADTKVTVSCSYPKDATVYTQWIAADDTTTEAMTAENYATAGTTTAEYTITVAGTIYAVAVSGEGEDKLVSEVVSASYTIKEAGSLDKTVEIVIGSSSPVSYTDDVNDVSYEFARAGSSTDPKYYDGGIRLYAKGQLIISSGSRTITGITLEYTLNKTPGDFSANVGSWDESTKTWTGSANDVVLTAGDGSSGNHQVSKITVTFAD